MQSYLQEAKGKIAVSRLDPVSFGMSDADPGSKQRFAEHVEGNQQQECGEHPAQRLGVHPVRQ